MEHEIPFGNSNRENGPTFLDFLLFLGIFQWDEPTKRVPFTAQPKITEILTKWKEPKIISSTTDQFPDPNALIYIPYPRVNRLKAIPFTAAHTYVAHIWLPPPVGSWVISSIINYRIFQLSVSCIRVLCRLDYSTL